MKTQHLRICRSTGVSKFLREFNLRQEIALQLSYEATSRIVIISISLNNCTYSLYASECRGEMTSLALYPSELLDGTQANI